MARRERLFGLAEKIEAVGNIEVIMVYISEAHTKLWPLGRSDHPDPQVDLNDRLERANEFTEKNQIPYTVLVDTWEGDFEKIYQAWPDKYFLLDENQQIVTQSTYHKNGSLDGQIKVDCTEVLEKLLGI